MIRVLALNPSIDAEWRVEDVLWEEKNIVRSQRRWAGGKGVNVARWLKFLGANPELLLPLGGDTGREIQQYLRTEGLRARVIPLREASRVNVIVTTERGRQMRFNPPGPKLSAREWEEVFRQTAATCRQHPAGEKSDRPRDAGGSLVLSGSLPRGAKPNVYAKLIRMAREAGAKAFLDCDGPALSAGVAARPFLVKPNRHELAMWAGKELRTERSLRAAAFAMSEQTQNWVLVSLGADGALLIHARQNFEARMLAPRVRPLNTVGAGDALLAAVVNQVLRGAPPEEWLRHAVATGTAATTCYAGRLPERKAVSRIVRMCSVANRQPETIRASNSWIASR